jgi:opacity protein-like surface antigen
LAWAIHAGLSYAVSENLKLELAYRYLNMGNVQGPINCTGGCNPDSYRWHNLSAQDVMIGFRWMFNGPTFAGPPPPPPLPARG